MKKTHDKKKQFLCGGYPYVSLANHQGKEKEKNLSNAMAELKKEKTRFMPIVKKCFYFLKEKIRICFFKN